MPINHNTSFQGGSLRIKEQLMLRLPTSRSDRRRLDELYQCVRQQVMSFVLPGEQEANAFLDLVKGDDQIGWLFETALSPLERSEISCASAVGTGPYVQGWDFAAAHDPGQAGKGQIMAQVTPTSLLLPATLTRKTPDWRDQYEISVIQARNALAGHLTQADFGAITPDASHTQDQMVHCSLWRISTDAQALARIVTSGYVSASPETAVEASSLVDAMKQDVEALRPLLQRVMLQAHPKEPVADVKPQAAFPAAALGARHASDKAWDAVRWRV
jgi:hypothetical protein